MLIELKEGKKKCINRMDPNLPKKKEKRKKICVINQEGKSVNKERGQLSVKEGGIFNDSKCKVKLLQ